MTTGVSADVVEEFLRHKKNPNLVNRFISNELLKLSLHDRNAILEETHGVRCLAPDETPEKIQEALRQLDIELDKLPIAEKQAYWMSQQQQYQTNFQYSYDTIHVATGSSVTAVSTYVNTKEFRLRILRASLFDVPNAANRLVQYLELALHCFGLETLFRPVCLEDFTKAELKLLRTGIAQILPFRDRHGRRLVIIFYGQKLEDTIPERLRAKMVFYFADILSRDDAESQRKGIVVIGWSPHSLSYKFRITPETRTMPMRIFSPIRLVAVHLCTPDTPFYRFARGMWAINLGRDKYSIVRFHVGEAIELRYALESHGITTDQLPITWTGTIKRQNIKQWMRTRQLIEEGNNDHLPSIIECPRLKDVIFRQGTSVMSHPGNAIFRSRIQSLYEEAGAESMARTTRSLVQALIKELRMNQERVLIWYQPPKASTSNSSDAWWTEVVDEDQMYRKIENLVREFKYSKAKYQAINRGCDHTNANANTTPSATATAAASFHQNTSSSTSIFLQSSKPDDCCWR